MISWSGKEIMTWLIAPPRTERATTYPSLALDVSLFTIPPPFTTVGLGADDNSSKADT